MGFLHLRRRYPPPPLPPPRWPLRGSGLPAQRFHRSGVLVSVEIFQHELAHEAVGNGSNGGNAFLGCLVSSPSAASDAPAASSSVAAARAFRHAPRGRDVLASGMCSRASISAAGASAAAASAPAGSRSCCRQIISDRHSRTASITTTTATGAPTFVVHRGVHRDLSSAAASPAAAAAPSACCAPCGSSASPAGRTTRGTTAVRTPCPASIHPIMWLVDLLPSRPPPWARARSS